MQSETADFTPGGATCQTWRNMSPLILAHLLHYCKNARVPFILQISRAKQNCEIKGCEYR